MERRRIWTYRANGGNDADSLMTGDQRELGDELAFVDVLPEVSAKLVKLVSSRHHTRSNKVSIRRLEHTRSFQFSIARTGTTDTTGADFDQDIVLTELGKRNLNNRVVLGLLVASEH